MKSFKALPVVFALLLCAVGAMAATHAISLDSSVSQIALEMREGDALRFHVDVAELLATDVATPEGAFSRLTIPGFHASHDVGAPELPMLNRLFEIPFGADAQVEILSVRTREINLSEFGIVNPLMPAQPSVAKNANLDEIEFIYDAAAYRAEPVAQELVNIIEVGTLRSVRFGRLEVSPVAYYPSQGKIVVTESVDFRVNFSGIDYAREARVKALTASPFFDHLYDGFAGLRESADRENHDDHPDRVRDVVTMVVVTPPEFEIQLADFVQWKTERGFITILAVTGTPEVGTTKEQIRDYLHGLYNNGTPEQPAPSFVLFVGDVAEMPTWTLGGNASDRTYCCVDGDLIPDMYYGRFSATNPTQLQAILDKSLMYDKYEMPDPSYLAEVVMIAGMDGGFGASHGNGQINYGVEHYFNAAHDIYSHTYLYPNSGSNAANIIQNVSDGVSYINYTAHGGTTSWSNPSFTQANINGLQNDGKYCLAVGNCCLTSSYQVGECFAETWLRAANKGAIGYIGGSDSTYWDEDYWWGVGFHPSSEINGSAYPVEDTGMGVYDGLFHDHGEAMPQWYVTNDAVIFSGNLAVTESGSTRTEYYWNIYNLMGDPSISTWMGTPQINDVIHIPTLFTTSTSLMIEANPNSYCGLTKDGVLVGAGTVDETGVLDMAIWDFMEQGSAKLVVMAQFCEPYVTDINVIVPATITMDPSEIDANVATTVTIGVFESDGVTPKPGINVWAEGLDYSLSPVMTDAYGYADLLIDYAYGPSIDIVGQDPADPWRLFTEPLTVNAETMAGFAMRVTTDIGLNNAFPMNLPGTLEAYRVFSADPLPTHELWAFVNDTPVGFETDGDIIVTATEEGLVTGVFARDGYDLLTTTFPIIQAFGTLTGHVDAAGSPANGAVVKGWDGEMNLVFSATCNAAGDYDMGEDILVADYTVTVDYFGYLPYEEDIFVNYGANVHDINLVAAPSGVITGTITEIITGLPLEGTVKVYRSDNMELLSEVVSDAGTGEYTTGSLPYFDYVVNVRAWHHIQVSADVTVDDAVIEKHFVLETTSGDILLVDDSAKRLPVVPEIKNGETFNAAEYMSSQSKVAADMIADLEAMGYAVISENIGSSDPADWLNYDMLISCSGDNTDPLGSATTRTALVNFVLDGGILLIEGGEIGYDHNDDTNFASNVLHCGSSWYGDNCGAMTIEMPSHPVVSYPNVITGPVTLNYSYWGDSDALDASYGGEMVTDWTSDPGKAGLIAYYNDTPDVGQIVFYAFNYSALDSNVRPFLLENTIAWLLAVQTAVDEQPVETVPTAVALGKNFPNPFNPTTKITFDLPSAAMVDLAVYDVTGRRIVTLLSGSVDAGSHEQVWQGRDEAGNSVASGLYFSRLQVGREVLTRKMMLLK